MSAILALAALATAIQVPSIDQYTQSIKDISFTMDVRTGNQAELRKISGDFGQAYRFEHMTFKVKDSFEIRGDTKVDDMSVAMIMRNGVRIFRAPGKGLNIPVDVRNKPGQRQTLFEFGLITPKLFEDFLVAKFVRNDRATNEPVYDVAFNPRYGDKTRYRIWVDPVRKYTTKKEWYSQEGNLKATFLFTEPEQVGSFWVPTLASVDNAEGRLAGALKYSKFRINAGIDDSVFK